MEDNGARSNPLETDKVLHLKGLLELKQRVTERPVRLAVSSTRSRRQGSVLAAVTAVLEIAEAPMRYVEVKAGVEALLGEAVPGSTVREALSANSRGARARFQRVTVGRYHLSPAWGERRYHRY